MTIKLTPNPDTCHSPYLWNTNCDTTELLGYGAAFNDASQEWQIVVVFTTRQDGKTSWAVTLVEVDSVVRSHNGFTQSGQVTCDRINEIICQLTRDAGWLEPINSRDETNTDNFGNQGPDEYANARP